MLGHEITAAPITHRPANDRFFHPRLRGFLITCRFNNGAQITISSIAPNSSLAIERLDRHFADQINGYTVKRL